jgi:hypothetical protein
MQTFPPLKERLKHKTPKSAQSNSPPKAKQEGQIAENISNQTPSIETEEKKIMHKFLVELKEMGPYSLSHTSYKEY